MICLRSFWNQIAFNAKITIALVVFLSACTSTTPTPSPTPYPTPTPIPASEAFLRAVQERVNTDDTIPKLGHDAVIALIGNRPTRAFPENRGVVLQFNVFDMPGNEPEIKKTAVLLMGTGYVVAGENQIPITGIEVVYYLADGEPWLALAIAPPWDMVNDLRLAPLHPEYIRRLLDARVITPTPEPTY